MGKDDGGRMTNEMKVTFREADPQKDLEGKPLRDLPGGARVVLRGKGKHFEKLKAQLIEAFGDQAK
jgi:hypothetical protein